MHLRSPAELRAVAPRWDDLWRRSDVSVPLARAEVIAHWLEHFAPRAALHAVAVERDGRFVAALPLVASVRGGVWRLGGLPSNAWGLCGDLLLDRGPDADAALDLLVAGMNQLAWPLLRLTPVPHDTPRWQALLAAADRRRMATLCRVVGQVGQVAVQTSWSEYQQRWSGNHRRQLRKARKRAQLAGELSLEVHREFPSGRLEKLLRLGCEIEDLSWKGEAGTSILRAPRMFEWYLRQARQLADWGQLQLAFLRHGAAPIAFEYGCWAKGTYYSCKVGYDPAYSHFSPGQLLRALLLERFHTDGQTALVDYWGPLTEATAKWCTHRYSVARILIAPDRLVSRWAMASYARLRRRA